MGEGEEPDPSGDDAGILKGGGILQSVERFAVLALTILAVGGFALGSDRLVDTRSSKAIGQQGTLIVLVPTRDGFVISSDSRAITLGVACDNSVKIQIPKRPALSVVAASGTATWITARVPLWPHDPCGDLDKNGVTIFDPKSEVVKYLEASGTQVRDADLQEIANLLTAKIIAVAEKEPAYVSAFAGKQMFNLILAGYEPSEQRTYVRSIELNLSPDGRALAANSNDFNLPPDGRPGYLNFGDIDNFRAVVFGEHKHYLPPSLEELLGKPSIRDVSNELAADVAVNLVEAAKSAKMYSIGGAVSAFRVTAGGVERLK
ncbi:hypothetical protein ABH994_001687 [Bradyrhizobium yuanmingense]|uniref:hypothetical protein n=1 Tax=Bradyrhizobium yuanmingense TaxID=108015 RepID=UPI0035147E37